MKLLFTICWITFSNIVFAQFAIIADKDGVCNIRNSGEIGNNIIDKLKNGHFVYCFESKGNWVTIDYTKDNKELGGQVYEDRLKYISEFPGIPVVANTKNKIVLGKDSIKISITTVVFDGRKYKLSFHKEYKDQLEFVNGKRYWGTDGEIPTRKYQSIEILIRNKKVLLPAIALDNLFEPSLSTTLVNYDAFNDILYIQSANSDGAGAYEVIWKVEKGIYKDRYVAYGF
jgi:hypothetical protein